MTLMEKISQGVMELTRAGRVSFAKPRPCH